MSQSELAAILDECVSRLRQGEAPEACLADHPAQADELALDLALAASLFQLSILEPSPDSVTSGYQKMMAALDARPETPAPAGLFVLLERLASSFRQRQDGLAVTMLRMAAIAVVLLVVAGSFVITAAADTLPGDMLYPVKRSWEDTRLSLTTDESSRQTLQTEFERRRRAEVQAVLELRIRVIVEFKGMLESSTAELWLVDGLAVTITDDTIIDGAIVIGRKITVRAQVRDDGSLTALKINGDEVRPRSTTTPSRTPPPTQNSKPSKIQATPLPTSNPEKSTERPPQASATPFPSDEPAPTRLPTQRPTVEATRTLEPTLGGALTREPSLSHTPSRDSLATSSPRSTNTPLPSDEPTRSHEPHPTNTPVHFEPTPSQRPTDEPRPNPTATSQPGREPTPTHEPNATRDSRSGNQNDRPP